MNNSSQSIHPNSLKYMKPPSPELILAVVDALNISQHQFERFFGLYQNCIYQATSGYRPIPAKYWHFFYEFDFETKKMNLPTIEKITKPKKRTKKRTKKIIIDDKIREFL